MRASVLECGSPLPLFIASLARAKRRRAAALQNLAEAPSRCPEGAESGGNARATKRPLRWSYFRPLTPGGGGRPHFAGAAAMVFIASAVRVVICRQFFSAINFFSAIHEPPTAATCGIAR